MVIGQIAEDPFWNQLAGRLTDGKGVVTVSGLWGSSAPLTAAQLARSITRPILYVAAHLDQADDAREDIEYFLGQPCELFPAWEAMPGQGPSSGEIAAERFRLCTRLAVAATEAAPVLIIAPIQALMQPTPSPAALIASMRQFAVDERVDPDEAVAWLTDHGFERLDLVESPGDFARRGDILDVFSPGDPYPVRLGFMEDRIESIRRFDLSTQRSVGVVSSFTVCAVSGGVPSPADAVSLAEYLPPSTVIVLDEPAELQDLGDTVYRRLDEPDSMFEVRTVLRDLQRFQRVDLTRFGAAADSDDQLRVSVRSLNRFEGRAAEAIGELVALAQRGEVIVVCDNVGEQRRLEELIGEHTGNAALRIQTTIGTMHRGFDWVATGTVLVGHHEVFHRTRLRRPVRRTVVGRSLETWLDLQPGDFVVHATHGIARFRSIRLMRKGDSGKTEEFLTLEFADRAVLHVPASQIDLVQKYVGAGAARPHLSKLGGTRWSRTKEKVSEAVAELAESLLRTQAAREANPGTAYPGDTDWQHEFEDAFSYEETEDQVVVADEIKSDLRRERPMDRLLCGDVGYGKTELAIRAAFKVAEYGKQVAMLVPTTVLAEQHYRTFSERLAEYPFEVKCLSRFRTAGEQKRIIDDVRKGRVDIVIGTHRLLSGDVSFSDLGLVVIDEEQRFGVEHKERLKSIRDTVDVLTMTATPIPRTLHMAMLGIRDISSLATPPIDRRSIATQVAHFNDQLVRDAIIREINRDGQVFFVHNVVRSIHAVAQRVQRIVPEGRIVVGHGQMGDHELEDVMHRFVNREADVLVATTIIESGIDIPSANTILINRADRFGLSDLHQLRGRVGRSRHRAYCYLLISEDRPVTPKAAKRLKSIEEFSELGAGFRIAMRDLEIRGAGDILGPQQSGHISAVGYEMYCNLLENAVRRLRHEPEEAVGAVHLELGVEAYIPHTYIRSERSRIDIHRRIVAGRTPEDIRRLEADLLDAFGPLPGPVGVLLELAEIRVLARWWRIRSILAEQPDIIFSLTDLSHVQPLFRDAPGSVRMPDPHTVHLRLRPGYFEPPTMLAYLRRLLSREPVAQEAAT